MATPGRIIVTSVLALGVGLWSAAPAMAHPHQAEPAENSPVHDADDTPLRGDGADVGPVPGGR